MRLHDMRDYGSIAFMNNTHMEPNWIPDFSTFGARLALIRWRMGWNIREAERECHLSQNTWGNWEEGALPRDLNSVANRIVLRTQVAKYWLLTGEGSPEPNREVGLDGLEPPTSSVKSRQLGMLIPFPRQA